MDYKKFGHCLFTSVTDEEGLEKRKEIRGSIFKGQGVFVTNNLRIWDDLPPYERPIIRKTHAADCGKYGIQTIYSGGRLVNTKERKWRSPLIKPRMTSEIIEKCDKDEEVYAFTMNTLRRLIDADVDRREPTVFVYNVYLGESDYSEVLDLIKKNPAIMRRWGHSIFGEWWERYLQTTKFVGEPVVFTDPDDLYRFWYK